MSTEERTDLKVADAFVTVEGILSEKTLEVAKDSEGKNIIKGELVVKVDDTNFIRLSVYVGEFTKAGEPNKAYSGMLTVMNEYQSIADVGVENATLVRCGKGGLTPNSYVGKDDIMVHEGVRYNCSFINRVKPEEFNPTAQFTVEGYINTMIMEIDKEGELTGRMKMGLYVPTYKGVEPLEIITDPEYTEGFEDTFERTQTAKFYGNLINRTIVHEKVVKLAVGAPRTETSRTYVNELITTGASMPYEEEQAYATEAIQKGLAEREIRLDKEKERLQSEKKKGKSGFAQSTTQRSLKFVM